MKIRIHNLETVTVREIDYPGSVSLFVKVHYGAWGFYKIIRTARDHFTIVDAFTDEIIEYVSKA